MKISYLWLKEFLDLRETPEEVGDRLESLGFELSSLTRPGGPASGVVAARVESAEKHPNADKLSLCRVFDGKETLQIVCGAPNVKAGLVAPLARVGARLPGGQEIAKAVLRGVESYGMLCSARELALGDEHAGLLSLPEDTVPGTDVSAVLELDDAILDVEVTPNRPDALSHWGLARDLAALLKRRLRMPSLDLPKAPRRTDLVRIEAKDLCSRYVARVIEGVAVRPSPLRVRLRLERCGIRAISNVVDVTNYVLLELGHPLHAFDLDKLEGGAVTVRLGRGGEKLDCLDAVSRPMEGALVIADAARPVALAGVIGGQPTAVGEGSTRLLLESAVFLPAQVRRARSRLAVSTESSYRFERGTDPTVCDWASRRAASLLLTLAGGRLTGEQDSVAARPKPVSVAVSPARVNSLLSSSHSPAAMKSALQSLGFTVKGGAARLTVVPPVHRADVRDEADVAEEVARLAGYGSVPLRQRMSPVVPDPASAEERLVASARGYFTQSGFFEARNYGLLSREVWTRWVGPAAADAVELANPLSLSGELLAPSLLPHLAANLRTNLRRGVADPRLFETARAFASGKGRPTERLSLAWVASGRSHGEHWKHRPRPLDLWDAKSWVKSLLMEWRAAGVRFTGEALPPYLHPGEAQSVAADGAVIGCFGRVHPRLAREEDLPEDLLLGELDLTALSGLKFLEPAFRGLPKHPSLVRDFSLVFPDSVAWSTLAHRLFALSDWVENAELFDVFQDASLPAGHRSLAFRISFRHPERTLTDAEAAQVQEKILQSLRAEFGASLRAAAPQGGDGPARAD
jgi:phenylalanyl-tRNA synthetase beta chain